MNDRIKKKRGLFRVYDLEKTVLANVGFGIAELLFGDDTKSPVKLAVESDDTWNCKNCKVCVPIYRLTCGNCGDHR